MCYAEVKGLQLLVAGDGTHFDQGWLEYAQSQEQQLYSIVITKHPGQTLIAHSETPRTS